MSFLGTKQARNEWFLESVLEMVTVNRDLLRKHLSRSSILQKAYSVLMNDPEVKVLLRMSNVMAVHRLRYNDHGPIHADIVAGAALEIFERILSSKSINVVPSSIRDKVVPSVEYSRIIVMYAALLHDIGNSIHRDMHEKFGALLAKELVDRALAKIVDETELRIAIRQEILHAIYSTAYDLQCLSLEAGVVKVADGLDMAEGRARMPYKLGKMDIHAVSALSIKRVEIDEGRERPLSITVIMDDMAGLFQVEKVLLPKIETSGIADMFEVYISAKGRHLRVYP